MNTASLRRGITQHKCIAACIVGLALLVGAANSHATVYTWTNNTPGVQVWENAANWTNGGSGIAYYPTNGDDAYIGNGGPSKPAQTYYISINNNVLLNSIMIEDGTFNTETVTLDIKPGVTVSCVGDVNTTPPGFSTGQWPNATSTVYIASSTNAGTGLYVVNTNSLLDAQGNFTNQPASLLVARNGSSDYVIITNGNVVVNQTKIGNGSNTSNDWLIISGVNTYYSNTQNVAVNNKGGTSAQASQEQNYLVVSNSASMTVLGALMVGVGNVGSVNGNGANLVIDNARLFTYSTTNVIGGGGNNAIAGGSNNTAVVRNGGVWDNGGQNMSIGNVINTNANASTQNINNSLSIYTASAVQHVSTLTITTNNILNLQGGILSANLTTNFGTVQGFGSIAGNVINFSTAATTPGSVSLVYDPLGFTDITVYTTATIAFSNNLTLAGTTILKLQKGGPGQLNDFLNVFGGLTLGGTLSVTNVGTDLAYGDQFTLFSGLGGITGSFTTTNMPSLDPGLSWNTSELGSQGVITVIPEPSTLVLVGAALGFVTVIRRRRS